MKKSPLLILLTDTHLNKDNIELNRSIFDQAADLARELKMKRIYHAGDIFDNRVNQSQRTLIAFKLILRDLMEKGIELVAIPGNHDKVDYEANESYLSVYTEYPNFHLFEKEGWINEGHVAIGMLPYYKESTTYPDRLENLLLKQEFKAQKKSILITHIATNGVRNNDGTKVEAGIPPNAFDAFDKVFVGHYHNAQTVTKNIIYPGSTFPHNFGEDNKKGILIINEDLSHEYAQTDFPCYHKLEYQVGKKSSEKAVEEWLAALQEKDHMRIEIVGEASAVQAFDKTIFTDRGISVKKKNAEIETNVSSVETEVFEAHNADSIFKEFGVFCKEQKIPQKEVKNGQKYLNVLQDVEW